MQVKFTNISYIGTLFFKYGLNRILVCSGFGLEMFHCTCIIYKLDFHLGNW